MKKILIRIIYISSWIITSLGLGQIINVGLIHSGSYPKGDSAETIVFALSGLLGLAGATSLYGEVFSKTADESNQNSKSIENH